jgi:chaperonin GroEL
MRRRHGAVITPGYGDRHRALMEAGIVDLTKVVRVALENAFSVVGTLLLTEAALTEVREQETAKPAGELAEI